MTIDPLQTRLLSTEEEAAHYEHLLALQLRRLQTWTKLPDERTDWALEQLLDELGTSALALRRLRGDADLPF